MRRCRARSRRPWRRRCGLAGSAVLRAAFWPTTALLLLLVAGLLAICLVLHCCCGTRLCPAQAPMAAAGWCWCLFIMNSSVLVYLAQSGSLDVLELVGEVGCAGWRGLQRHPAAQRRVACVGSGVGRLVRHVVNGLLEIFGAPRDDSSKEGGCQGDDASSAAAAVTTFATAAAHSSAGSSAIP